MTPRWFPSRQRQAGSSTIQLLCYLLSGWLVLTILLRLTPIYLEHRTALSVLETIISEYDPSNDSSARIKQKLNTAWSVNAIDQVDANRVRVERSRSELKLILQYEVRFPILGDIVGVWAFDETLASP